MADLINIAGQKFGRLTVLEKAANRKTSGGKVLTIWKCQCDCGNIVNVESQRLRKGHTTSCGCRMKDNVGSHYEDLTGKKFGRLTVLHFIPQDQRRSRQYCWWCRCDCGKEVPACANKLKSGTQKSCGCLKEEVKTTIGNLNKKYKYSNKRLYSVYKSMIQRCTDQHSKSYHNYGGRGIVVCEEWLAKDGYDVFAEWALSNGYDINAEHGRCTLERKDVNGMYSPDNCCWITNQEQQNNRRGNVKIEYNGEVHTAKEWSRILDISYSAIRYHVIANNRSLGDALKSYKDHH